MMKDLDFDELDRAVNSLMEGVSRSAPEPPKSQEKVVTITPSADNGASFGQMLAPQSAPAQQTAAPSPSNPSPTPPLNPSSSALDTSISPPSQPATVDRSSQLPARRNSGRFMDVVHPSSDMKNQTPQRPVSRQGVSITPSATSDVSSTRAMAPAITSPRPTSSQSEPTAPDQLVADWPDPIDMQSVGEEPSTSNEQAPDRDRDAIAEAAESLSNDQSSASDEKSSYDPAPLQTPFLSDPKVEKRPLGGFASNLHDAAVVKDAEPLTTPSTIDPEELRSELQADKQTVTDPEPIAAPELPDELRRDVMAIESDTSNTAPESEASALATPKPQMQVQSLAEASVVPAPAPSGPSSIAQQYRQEPSTNESAHGGIYDTDSYHQPLLHPAKNKSGWLVVVWVALLLLLGGGGAAALYYLGII